MLPNDIMVGNNSLQKVPEIMKVSTDKSKRIKILYSRFSQLNFWSEEMPQSARRREINDRYL